MMKKKLTALVAVLLVCLLLFPCCCSRRQHLLMPQTEKALRLRRLRLRVLMPSRLPVPPKRWETQRKQMDLNPAKTIHFPLMPMS